MKKATCFLGVLLIFLSNPVIFAQGPSVTPQSVMSTPAVTGASQSASPVSAMVNLERIGVVAAVKGAVSMKMPNQTARQAVSGQPVFSGDEVTTDAQGNLQVLLLDQTVFTIGANSILVLDEFVYDSKTHDGKVKASIPQGVFRYVSGKIAAKKPGNVTLKLPTATIGIRGTIVGGNVVPGGNSLAGLLGPGVRNNAGANPGSFSVTGTAPGAGSQNVERTGFGVNMGADGSVSGVFQLSTDQINQLSAGSAPSGGGSDEEGEGGSATEQSGQGNVDTGDEAGVSGSLSSLSNDASAITATGAQDAADASETIQDGITQVSDLTRITTGQYHYSGTGTFFQYYDSGVHLETPIQGTMTTYVDIDFGARTIGGNHSRIEINTGEGGINDTASISQKNFSELWTSGNAIYNINTSTNDEGTMTGTITLTNSGGVVANGADISVSYTIGTEGYESSGSGSCTAPRSDGLQPS